MQTGLHYINSVRGSPTELLHTEIVNVNEIALYTYIYIYIYVTYSMLNALILFKNTFRRVLPKSIRVLSNRTYTLVI